MAIRAREEETDAEAFAVVARGEPLEEARNDVGGHARAFVDHVHRRELDVVLDHTRERDVDGRVARRVLDRVPDQVLDALPDARRVEHGHDVLAREAGDRLARSRQRIDDLSYERCQVVRPGIDVERTMLDPGDVEDVVDEGGQSSEREIPRSRSSVAS